VDQVGQLKQLRDENTRLKQLVAEGIVGFLFRCSSDSKQEGTDLGIRVAAEFSGKRAYALRIALA